MGKSAVNINLTEEGDNEMQVGEVEEVVADEGMEGGRWTECVKS